MCVCVDVSFGDLIVADQHCSDVFEDSMALVTTGNGRGRMGGRSAVCGLVPAEI